MANVPLSPATLSRIEALFSPPEHAQAERLLVESCGSNLPLLENAEPESLERVRFAALKVSNGQLSALRSAVELAATDWRDLLVAAEFADDPDAHKTWSPGEHAA